jgi:hypothetical protein
MKSGKTNTESLKRNSVSDKITRRYYTVKSMWGGTIP